MTEAQPLRPTSVGEVHLPQTPLASVIAQVRFPRLLSIGQADTAAAFQEVLRQAYLHLVQEHVHHVTVGEGASPGVSHASIWRLADQPEHPDWRVSLDQGFVALDTRRYVSRDDFLERLALVLHAVEDAFGPASATRLGVRYIDRMTGNAVRRADELLAQKVLGVASQSSDQPDGLAGAIVHLMTQAQFRAPNGNLVHARWGKMPPNATHDQDVLDPVEETSWILDMDMYTSSPSEFATAELVGTARSFAECLYWLFREIVTDDFLVYYGAKL